MTSTKTLAHEIDQVVVDKPKLLEAYKYILIKYPKRSVFIDFHFEHKHKFQVGSKPHIGAHTIKWRLNEHLIHCQFRRYKNIRITNLSEIVSENMIRLWANKHDFILVSGKTGDLYDLLTNKRVEIKSFQSEGPTSFGPKEQWDILFFLGVLNEGSKIIVQVIDANMNSFKEMKINKNETFGIQQEKGKRPRIVNSQMVQYIKTTMPSECFKEYEYSYEDFFKEIS